MPTKKETKTSVKKRPTKSATEKAATKKPASKKKVMKKLANDTAVKKVSVKKNTREAPPKSKVRSSTTTKTKSGAPKPTKEVKLPSNASVRMIEKAGVLQVQLDKYIRDSAFKIAYVAGLCFMLVGASFAASQIHTNNLIHLNPAQTISTQNTLDPAIQTTQPPAPVFEIINQAPKVTDDKFSFVYSATNIKDTSIEIKNVDKGKKMPSVTLDNKSGDKYRADIPADTYEEGLYRVTVYITAQNQDVGNRAYSQEFYVESEDVEDEIDEPSVVDDPISGSAMTQTDTARTATYSAPDPYYDDAIEDTTKSTTTPSLTQEKFEIKIPDTEVSGSVRIEIKKPDNSSNPELYARPTNSLNSKYIVSGVTRNDKLVFTFDSSAHLPNGNYELYSTTKKNSQLLTSNSLFVTVRNQTQTINTNSDPINTVSEQPPQDTPEQKPEIITNVDTNSERNDMEDPQRDDLISHNPKPEDREFVEIEEPKRTTSTRHVAKEVEKDYEQTIERNTDDLNKILRRYAAAQQAGDEALIRAAKEELDNKRKSIVSGTLRDEKMRDHADDFDKELEEDFEKLRQKVETFEKIRKDKSSGGSAKDTDKDGISDVDEVNIFNTDPNSPDSDNDGFNDGVEIVRGFNPTDDSPEAVVVFRSPKESKVLTREDVLSVDEIIPITDVEDAASSTAPVTTEIRGRGLPNSYLTLFIFSQPTVVTVRTDEDGAFVYTFDKELEDGEHEVYIAVTDNTGDIIAQSSPFSFVKTAQAFTPVDASEADLISSETIIESTSSTYGIVAGMGLLALGLILVMLGISLRSRNEEPELITLTGGNSNNS